MEFLRRLLGQTSPPTKEATTRVTFTIEARFEEPDPPKILGDWRGPLPAEAVGLLSGVALEVVGESYHQDEIVQLIGGRQRERIRATYWATLVPEPDNEYDSNAISVRINDTHMGYVSRRDAQAYRPIMERVTAGGRVAYVRADIVGGGQREDGEQAAYGVFVYAAEAARQKELLDRELDGKSRAEIARAQPALREGKETGPGTYRGRHHTVWHSEVRRLRAAGDEEAAEVSLRGMVDAMEAEAGPDRLGVPPGAYNTLAVIYRKRKDRDAEIAILERYERQPHAPGALAPKVMERLAALREQ